MNHVDYHQIYSGPWVPGVLLPIHNDCHRYLELSVVESLLADPPPEIALDQLAAMEGARITIIEVDDILARLSKRKEG